MPGRMTFSLLCTAVLVCWIYSGTAHAIAAFTREHKAECTTCHTIYPELNEYGEVFLKNGYVYSNAKQKAQKPAQAPILGQGGDPLLMEGLKSFHAEEALSNEGGKASSDLKNEGLLLSAIPVHLPLSVTAILNASYTSNAAKNDDLDFSSRAIVLQSGGNFREKAGFYATYTLYSEGNYNPSTGNSLINNPNVPKNNNSDLTELFLVWRHTLDTPINLKIGRMRPKLSLWKSSNKISVSSFAPHVYTVGDSPYSIDASEDAAEANALLTKRLFVAAGIVNRKGQQDKEGYGHLSYRFGGADFLGNEPEIDFDSDSIWDYLSVTMGLYGYNGRNANIVTGIAQNFNNYYRIGMDLDILYKKLRIRASGVIGRDTNPYYLQAPKSAINSVAVATEAEYMFDTNLMAAFRYEYVFDQTHVSERNIYIPYLAYSPLQNIRVVLEYRWEDYVMPSVNDNKIANLGISFSY